jgi:Zn-dependent protease
MPQVSWKLGRVAGIDLFLHPSFLILPLMVVLGGGDAFSMVVILGVFACVVLHELGHALMARRYGIGTADITLYPIGGVARLDRMPRGAGPEMLIALAGPAVNLGIAAALWSVLTVSGASLGATVLGAMIENLLSINLMLFAFNMLPVFPMDGGRVLRAALSGPLGRARATEVAATIGRGIAVVAGLYFLFHGLFLQAALALFIYTMAGAEVGAVRREEWRRKQEFEGWPAPPPGYRWMDRGDGVWRLVSVTVSSGSYRVGPWS